MSDLFGKLNNFVESYQKATNPVFDVLPGGQILNAPTSYVLDQIGRHNADRTDYLNRPEDPGTGRLEPTLKERILLGGDADAVVQQTTKKQLGKKYGKDSKRFGYSLTDDKGNTRLPSAVKADSDFYAMPEAREAVARGLSLDPSMDTAQSIARKTQRKDLEESVTDLDPSFSVTGISDSKLRSQLRQLQRSDKYGSLTTGADGKPLGSAQLDQAVITEAEGNRLQQQAEIKGKAAYGDLYGTKGSKELDLDIAGKSKYGDLYGTAGTAQLDNQLALGLYKDKLGADFNSQGARYERYRDQEGDRRSDYRFDVKRADSIAAQRAEIDLAKLKMQHEVDIIDRQHEMDMDVYQQNQISNLVGGLFSLGSLL